jgi:hypothetical protein
MNNPEKTPDFTSKTQSRQENQLPTQSHEDTKKFNRDKKALLTLLAVTTLFAFPFLVNADSPDAEMGNYQKYLADAFRDFPDKAPSNSVVLKNRVISDFQTGKISTKQSHHKDGNCFSTANLNKAAQSDYTKAQFMKTISQLAMAWAQSAGSIQGLQSSNQAGQLATSLSASSDPQFQQMGGILQQESTSIGTGDRPTSENFAGQIQSINPPYVPPNYQPTQSESWLVQAFNTAASTVLTTLAGVLGMVAVQKLLSGMGIDPSSFVSGLGGSVGSGLGRSAVSGQSASPVLQGGAQSGAAQGSQNLSSAIQQSSGSLVNTKPVAPSQSGSVPSAGN